MTYLVLAVLAAFAVGRETDRDFAIVELVYDAEVHGRRDAAESALREMLETREDPAWRRRITRALSIVKYGKPGLISNTESGTILAGADNPHALILYRNVGRVLIENHWLEPGDWLGDYFLLEAAPGKLIFEHRDGFLHEVPLVSGLESDAVPIAAFYKADIRDLLIFLTRQLGLNSFIPSGMEREISGTYHFDDWLSLVDSICVRSDMTWTRRGESLIFRMKSARIEAETIKLVDSRNEDLVTFLQNLALTFDMELVLEGDLAEIKVDIHLQDQPWDEVLECLSIMNDFSWFLIREPGERARLYIQKG